MYEKPKVIEKGIIITPPRKLIDLGGSKAIILPMEWLKIQKWLGREIKELVAICNEVIIFTTPDNIEKAKQILLRFKEKEKHTNA